MTEVALAAAITVSVAGASYVAFNPDALARSAQSVADRAACRAVNQAILAHIAANGRPPATTNDLEPYVDGDISAYRIVRDTAAGPGC